MDYQKERNVNRKTHIESRSILQGNMHHPLRIRCPKSGWGHSMKSFPFTHSTRPGKRSSSQRHNHTKAVEDEKKYWISDRWQLEFFKLLIDVTDQPDALSRVPKCLTSCVEDLWHSLKSYSHKISLDISTMVVLWIWIGGEEDSCGHNLMQMADCSLAMTRSIHQKRKKHKSKAD